MKRFKQYFRRSSLLAVAVAFSGVLSAQAITIPEEVSAAQITERSLMLSNSASGTIDRGQDVTYTFEFTVPGDDSPVQGIDFQFCTSPLPGLDCDLPTGQDVESAVLDDQQGLTGWSLGTGADEPTNSWQNGDSGEGGLIRITRAETGNVDDPETEVTITFDDITNPDDDNETFFVRIVTYEEPNWTEERDQGSVAASTVPIFEVVARVQETLNFSVGAHEPGDLDNPPGEPPAACTSLVVPTVALGDEDGVLSFSVAHEAHSYFRLSTNALHGVSIYYAGTTLTNDGLTIDPIGPTAEVSEPGEEQFGLALTTGPDSYLEDLVATSPYDNGDGDINDPFDAEFAFDPDSINEPVEIASAPSVVPCDQGEIRYIGNIEPATAPGIYTAEIGYIATPRF